MIAENEYATLRHDMKTSLTTIRLYSEALLSGSAGQLTDQQREHIEEIQRANNALLEKVSRFGKSHE